MNYKLWGFLHLGLAFANLMVIIVIDWKYIIMNYIAFGVSLGIGVMNFLIPSEKDRDE